MTPGEPGDVDKPQVLTHASSRLARTEKPSLVELKNGKVIFKQKPMSFEKLSETMQGPSPPPMILTSMMRISIPEIVNFRGMLEQRLERHDTPLTDIPDDYKPVIAKLAHERFRTLPTT